MRLAALFLSGFVLLASRGVSAQQPSPSAGPKIDLAPEHSQKPADPPPIGLGASPATRDEELARGLTERRFDSAERSISHTSVGGYGEFLVAGTEVEGQGDRTWIADIPRLVLFVAHTFNDRFRAYTEIEVEHALACSSCPGALELEQAYVDWRLLDDGLGLRAGLVLVPMGIINQWHEPPIYHGAVRPRVETIVIPSTWRELAIGIFGNPIGPLRYEVYGMTGLDPSGFSADRGIGRGRQGGALAKANGPAVVGRVEVEPLLGVIVGAAAYASEAGGNADHYDATGNRVEISVPVFGWAADARWRRSGLEWKLLYAEWFLPEAGELMTSFDENGVPRFDPANPVPTHVRGGYVELGYDVLRPLDTEHQLVPFARLERYDTQVAVPDGFTENDALAITAYTFGVSYRPIQQIVFKGDYQLRYPEADDAPDAGQLSFGFGFMY